MQNVKGFSVSKDKTVLIVEFTNGSKQALLPEMLHKQKENIAKSLENQKTQAANQTADIDEMLTQFAKLSK